MTLTFLRRAAVAVVLALLIQPAAAQAVEPAELCVDFTLFPDDHPFPDVFVLGGVSFAAVSTPGELFANTSAGETGLQFTPSGIDIGFFAPSADIAMRIGTFAGEVTVTGYDRAGTAIASAVVPGNNSFNDIVLRSHGFMATVRLEGGGREGVLRSICAQYLAAAGAGSPDAVAPSARPMTAAADVGTADTVWVFRFDGTIQCSEAPEVTLAEDRAFLERLGPDVIAEEKRSSVVPAVCGAPTGRANAFEISAQDWIELEMSFVGPMDFALWPFDDRRTVEVYKYDGTLQCGMGQKIPLDTMAAELNAARIEVLSSREGNDGLMHIAVCGASTGDINVFTIRSVSLPTAIELGFLLLGDRGDQFMPMAGGLPVPWPFPW